MDVQANQFCEVAGHRLAYQRRGCGETILLVHGITTYSFIWRRLFPDFSSRYDVIAIDLLGCGNSDMPLDESYSIKRHAELLFDFICQLKVERFHFVGHDIGGGIGQVFAVRCPEYLYDLTLINTVAYDYWPVQPIIAARTPVIRQFVMASLDLGVFRQIVRRGTYHKERVDDELMDLFWVPMQTGAGRKAFLHFARSLDPQHLMEIEADLRVLNLPVLIIRGDADLYLSAAIAERLHREIPNSRLIYIPTAGHFIQEDEPEQLVDTIIQFFEETSHGER